MVLRKDRGEKMNIREIEKEFDLECVNKKAYDPELDIRSGYSCDLLSNVLSAVEENTIWLTIQSHMNIIGVATMADIPAIVVCEGFEVDDNVAEKADEEGIAIFKSKETAYRLAGRLYESGIK